MGLDKVLLVADPFLVQNGVTGKIQKGLESAGCKVVGTFSEIPPNSEVKVVKACIELAKKAGADGIVAIGGGSAIDTAKAANIVFSLGGDLVEDYSGTQTIPRNLKPLIVIPTTAGTGSEVTSAAVILDESSQTKLSFTDPHLRPALALLDPELTLSLPPKVTAMTGMDALTHAIEAITSVQANPMSEALAMEAIELISKNLLKAVEHGDDLEARSNMLIAANMAGIAFDHSMVGIVHAMSHASGGVAHVPHGLANSIFLPLGMEYNLSTSAAHYAAIARHLGLETKGLSEEAAAQMAIQYVRDLRHSMKQACGLPDRLRDAGVKEEQLETISEVAAEDGAVFYNPREVTLEGVSEKVREAF